MEEKLANFLWELTGDDAVLNQYDLDLFEAGILNSLNVVELLLFIEGAFGKEISPAQAGQLATSRQADAFIASC